MAVTATIRSLTLRGSRSLRWPLALSLLVISAVGTARHYRNGTRALVTRQLATERAASTDSLVNSIGVNTHLGYKDRSYYLQFGSLVLPRLKELGVLHIRDALSAPNDEKLGRMNELFKLGIRASLIVDPRRMTGAQAAAYVKAWGPVVEAVEGPNEPDWPVRPSTLGQYASSLSICTTHFGATLRCAVSRYFLRHS